jgi:hypothetical protein
MTEHLRAVLHHNAADVALILDYPHSAAPGALAAEVRDQLRPWAAVHAHYFPPDVIDRAADLLAGQGLPAAGRGRVLLPREQVMAWLHLAARH